MAAKCTTASGGLGGGPWVNPGEGGGGRARRAAMVESGEGGVRGQRVERLAVVRQVGDQSRGARQVERLQIDIEDGIAMGDEMRNGVAAGLAGSAGEDNALAGHGF